MDETPNSRFPRGTFAIAVADSKNKKLGRAATTYASQSSCPTSCPFYAGGGCYAEAGNLGRFTTAPLNRAANAVPHTSLDVARGEAKAIDEMKVVNGRPLRLHTVGDCASDEAAMIVAAAAARYRARGGGPVWTYTHAWRAVERASWGDVSVLASCETAADVEVARARGYATAVVVPEFISPARGTLTDTTGAPLDVLPCPQQTRGVTCSDCRLCFNDAGVRERGYSIGFAVHGTAFTIRQAQKALESPDDPDRKLTSRQLIPRVIAAIEAEGGEVTNSEIARRLKMSPSSVADMRRKLRVQAES